MYIPFLKGLSKEHMQFWRRETRPKTRTLSTFFHLIEAAAAARGGRKRSLATRVEEETVAVEVMDRAENRVCSIVPCLSADDSVRFVG
ncbi:hypothetical protein C1H46_011414 [Malus baccata]|uniref:Uncharacterized protein n=1 Tax=Malus baccata TaxID=106549 RepID=A0A540MXH7_MALBA|nr:hypothetical protein C1H46_011414 [Malus baccata]